MLSDMQLTALNLLIIALLFAAHTGMAIWSQRFADTYSENFYISIGPHRRHHFFSGIVCGLVLTWMPFVYMHGFHSDLPYTVGLLPTVLGVLAYLYTALVFGKGNVSLWLYAIHQHCVADTAREQLEAGYRDPITARAAAVAPLPPTEQDGSFAFDPARFRQ